MVEHFKGRDHIIYLDARRTEDGLEFGEFVITLDNFANVFIDPFLKEVTATSEDIDSAEDLKRTLGDLQREGKPIKTIQFSKPLPGTRARTFSYSPKLDEARVSGEELKNILTAVLEMDDESLQELAPFKISHAEKKFQGTKAEQLFGSFGKAQQIRRLSAEKKYDELLSALEETPGYSKSKQFIFTRKQAEDIAGFKKIGELKINPKILKDTWINYGDVLTTNVEPIYKALNSFTRNINDYFLTEEDPDGNHKQFGEAAAEDAKALKKSTDKAVK